MFVDIPHEYKKMPSVFMQKTKEMIKMSDKSYGITECMGYTQKDFCMIDNECASCLYEAGKIAQKDILGAVIANELSQDEQLLVRLHWFRGFSLNRISADFGIPRETVRRTVERAKKKIYATWITTTADVNNDYFIESNLADMPEGIELLEILDEVDNES